jgi:hypothetical protein
VTKDEALDLALEALEYIENNYMSLPKSGSEAITAIKQARALDKKAENARELGLDYEPEERYTYGTPLLDAFTKPAPVQEPVATLWQHGETGRTRITMPGDITDCDARWFKAADLYTTPPAAQRQCNWPTCQSEEYQRALAEQIKQELVTGAAQRQWVGLTDEEREAILDREFRQWWSRHDAVCRAIEAKLKEKNT